MSVAHVLAPILAWVILIAPALAEEPTHEVQTDEGSAQADLAALLAEILEGSHVPALGGGIVRGGEVTALGVAGVRARGDETPVTPGDLWHLGSCTKAMTATLVARLVEQGKLTWDTTIEDVLGEVIEIHQDYQDVTIRQLLQHLGGAPHDIERQLWMQLWKRKGTPVEQRLALATGVLAAAPAVAPGTSYLYSNAGYAIAGAMVEEILGEAWEEVITREVFTPLGMASTGFGAPGTAVAIDQPRGHRAGSESPAMPPGPLADNPPAIGPGGIVHGTLEDWARFVACHLAGAREDGDSPADPSALLTAQSFSQLHTPPEGKKYAAGWNVTTRSWAKGTVLTHSGSNTMWYCVVWVAPRQDLAVLVTCNQGGDEAAAACDRAAGALIRHALDH